MKQTNVNRMEEPTCCKCCSLIYGAVAIIVLHFIFGIWVFVHKIWPVGINNILCVIIGIGALLTKKKRCAFISGIMLFIGAIIFFIFSILILTFVVDIENVPEGDNGSYKTSMAIIFIIWAIFKAYWSYFWFKIAKFFEQEKQAVELVVDVQNPNYRKSDEHSQQDQRYEQAPHVPSYTKVLEKDSCYVKPQTVDNAENKKTSINEIHYV
jgi:hypothetical protein